MCVALRTAVASAPKVGSIRRSSYGFMAFPPWARGSGAPRPPTVHPALELVGRRELVAVTLAVLARQGHPREVVAGRPSALLVAHRDRQLGTRGQRQGQLDRVAGLATHERLVEHGGGGPVVEIGVPQER